MKILYVVTALSFITTHSALALGRSTGCAPSAEAAVVRMFARTDGPDVGNGYRVAAVRRDTIHGRDWAMVASCSRAAAPLIAIEVPHQATALMEQNIGIRLGERVRVIRSTGDSMLEVSGWAEQAGSRGDVIRVRLARLTDDTSEAQPVIRCKVAGQGVVEVVR